MGRPMVVILLTWLIHSLAATAGTCELRVTRTACPHKEDFSFRKCAGLSSCSATISNTSEAQCMALAQRACTNPRPQVTKHKQIEAKYDEKNLQSDNGDSDFCRAYAKRSIEFDQC